MKKLLSLLIALVMALSFATGAQAASKPLSIWVDGEQVQFGSNAPIVEKGTTLVPVRMLLEKLSFKIDWNEESRVVTATSTNPRNEAIISLQIDHTTAYVNSQPQQLTVAPKIQNKATYVPLRFIVEATGYEIDWNDTERTISIDTIQESRGFMWKVEKDGNAVYMLGSIHVANEAMYPLRDEIMDAFMEADHLALEIDFTSEGDMEDFISSINTYKDGTTLQNHISEETHQYVRELLTELGYESYSLDQYKPWFASLVLDELGRDESEYKAELGIDEYFMNLAEESKLPIIGLESSESQLNMLNNFSDRIQEEMLYGSIASFYMEEEPVKDLSDMWINGDLDMLAEMAVQTQKADEEYYKAMLQDRNVLMAEKIDAFLRDGKSETYFVVVGALHMAGEHGLVTLLEQKGYTVTRI
ncbi:polysaccharide biosynthesis protein GumN [Paenibacillus sp. 1011MAR3C5]|uniref:TraB/GumN family protein n=1 Tax=Paenibacillus sp. 1011MAR3C5 TaxID=1675787 RepID=UPI000E6BC2EC|nr:TraB/GumN family protein [Paenibacillus sp. 1011MAR3C5]RJE88677.1 polysaccharide biosynthesis protein GumN [Paenibacillus sp. 1011MAR3C5]